MPRPRRPQFSVLPDLPPKKKEPKPLFACPGLKEEIIPYALYPYGSDCRKPRKCPARDCCIWFCRHDLGGDDLITDFPDDAILPAAFRPYPFHCPHYTEEPKKKRKKKGLIKFGVLRVKE